MLALRGQLQKIKNAFLTGRVFYLSSLTYFIKYINKKNTSVAVMPRNPGMVKFLSKQGLAAMAGKRTNNKPGEYFISKKLSGDFMTGK